MNFICISSVSAYIFNLFIIKQKSLSSNALFIAVFVLPIFKEQIMTSKLMVQFNSIVTLYLGVEPLESFWNLVVIIFYHKAA